MVKKEYLIIGKPLPRVDAKEKVTGEAKFVDDIKLPRMLYGKILRSPFPHAKILKINTSKAEKLHGVRAIITAEDTPKIKFAVSPEFADKLPLENEKVRYIGDEVAAVAAESEEIAEEALNLIEVEYEQLPSVFDVEDAMKPEAPIIHDGKERNISVEYHWNLGDAEKSLQEADYISEDKFITSQQAHACLETHGCVASWDRTGKLTLWSCTQTPYPLRMELARVLNMPHGMIRVMKVSVGGGFGSKNEMSPHEPICALLAKKAGRPVKISFSREEEFQATRTRHPMIIEIMTGIKKDGTITAREVKLICDNGAYNSQGPSVMMVAGWVNTALYRVPNVKYDAYLVYTNKPYGGACRGFGNPQITFAIESQLDIIAEKLGIDPVELRLRNANQPGDMTVGGTKISSCGLCECIQKVADSICWNEKRRNKKPNQGVGVASLIKGCGARGVYGNCDISAALVKVNEDGTVNVIVGGIEIGVGYETVMAQIAAEELGVTLEDIKMVTSDTDFTPIDLGHFASRTTHISGNAVRMAAADAKRQLLEVAAEMLEARIEDLEAKYGRIYVKKTKKGLTTSEVASFSYYEKGTPIIGKGFHDPDSTLIDLKTGRSPPPGPSPTWLFGAQAVEVKLDIETGEVKVLKVVSAHDVGKAINPTLVEGQIEGALVMGLGYALLEGLVYHEGRVVNASFIDYKIFTAIDIPKIIPIYIETIDPKGPFGAKGIGEPPIVPTAAAIANAIYDATGVRIKELPITPEKVLKALKQNVCK